MVRPAGLEPATLGLEGRCSIQLSYERLISSAHLNIQKVVGVERFELPTSCSQSRRATRLRYTPSELNNIFLSKVGANLTDANPVRQHAFHHLARRLAEDGNHETMLCLLILA